MSSYITIGFVFKNEIDSLPNKFEDFILFLKGEGVDFISVKFSLDERGEKWHEEKINSEIAVKESISLLSQNYFGEMKLNMKLSNIACSLEGYISLKKHSSLNMFAFFLDINERELNRCFERLEESEKKIISFIKRGYEKLRYKYAFCDHEQHSLTENLYSIEVLPSEGDLKVKRGSWMIDGLTVLSD